ncbi:MAG: hypothetical protein A3G18_08875 [Rhodospirillales bacterium RIFCSPLOWO2_12_FULL_58_28]|nr:MAG: hypothetical protein A3H92_01470 [Rhodospirillales bacterium RIFCSPLOWO2_02_FULL_58_16]OHC78419.1 MAG: hypothetical protein A3G18_08875 [Rhodospirillales bacterium RIFCSPLOWO2_12_FULL_58_28]
MISNIRNISLRVGFCLAVVLGVGLSAVKTDAAQNVPWKEEMFEGFFQEEDVKNALRSVLRQNGLQVIFRPGVDGKVSGEFKMPLQGAFNKLIEENGLQYDYDTTTRMVTIFTSSKQGKAQDFVPMGHATQEGVMAAMRAAELGGRVSFIENANTALVEGSSDQVKTLRSLIESISSAGEKRAQMSKSQAQDSLERQRLAVDRQNADVASQLAAQKSEVQKKLLSRLLDSDSRVIPLRFAAVADTRKVFHGKEITVPGIDVTLNKLLGDQKKALEGLSKEDLALIKEIAPEKTMSGMTISVDARTNSVIARGTPDELDRIEKLVRQLDKPVPMVEIEVIIVKAERGLSDTLGLKWAAERSANAARVAGVSGATYSGANTGITSANPDAVAAGLGGAAAGAAEVIAAATQTIVGGYVWQGTEWALQTQLSAFEKDNKAQTIASPTLVTLNNVPARVERTGSEHFVSTTGQNMPSTLQEINVGLVLDITPSVILREDSSDEELVRLSVTAKNTTLSTSALATSVASASGQEVQTEVIIPNERTFMMGGLLDDTRSDNTQGVPYLRRIPFLGKLFGTDTSTDTLVETIFFITPKIIFPEEILPRDIAERRYLQSRKMGLSEMRKDVQGKSDVSTNNLQSQEEDE